jgi:hypothetical protein
MTTKSGELLGAGQGADQACRWHDYPSRGGRIPHVPDDIHSLHPHNERPALLLPMYGRALNHLPKRMTLNIAEDTYRVFPASPNIRETR